MMYFRYLGLLKVFAMVNFLGQDDTEIKKKANSSSTEYPRCADSDQSIDHISLR